MNTKLIEQETNNFISALIPFGCLDINRAIEIAIEVEEDGEWVVETINNYLDATDSNMGDVDVVYCVYEDILQESRHEIEELTKLDFLNDLEIEIYTAGNYLATSYDNYEETAIQLIKALKENNITKNQLSIKLIWFLNEIETDLEELNEE